MLLQSVTIAGSLTFATFIFGARLSEGAVSRQVAVGDVVATVGERQITDQELEDAGKERLARVKAEALRIKRQVLDELITQELLAAGARKTGVTVSEFEKSALTLGSSW